MADGAIHDSEERRKAPKCMEETRVAVQEDITSWIEAGDQSRTIMWVTGPAGAGKTAILGTIADACKEKGTLAAGFFFSASANGRKRRCLVPTLAYQLMNHGSFPRLREHILSSLVQDPIMFKKDMKAQFNALILNGLCRATHEPGGGNEAVPRLIIIDGLDECDEESDDQSNPSAQAPTRTKEEEQEEILSLLLLATTNPSFPFRILIASRPEVCIRDFFDTDGKACTRKIFLDNKYDPDADIALFYDARFSIICRRFGINPEDWPGKIAKRRLVRNASGQFIYAATTMRYLDGSTSQPHQRLEQILGLAPAKQSPLDTLDALYRLLLKACPNPELSMKWLRATQMRNAAGEKSPVWLLRLVLEASPGEENYALGSLASLLSTEHSGESLGQPYPFYHKSFLDFIEDPTRCTEGFLNEEEVLTWMAQRFFQTLDRRKPSSCVPLSQTNTHLKPFKPLHEMSCTAMQTF
ncbi:hypothetical protein DFP72DRAFT_829245 [Ephemerocybe angulata]|uniref:NACHT domain-containing protein n=1 Tax=Ephemerocybe angulata TaxID=980116 RepID=A0A8H6LU95_9AGAR|nr:hypothetical protein DFP72DRAFT_829245 [Tulosesus angulatus]